MFLCRQVTLIFVAGWFFIVLFLPGCATETHLSVPLEHVNSRPNNALHPKIKLVINNFVNKSTFQRGLFAANNQILGEQAKTLLKTQLDQSQRFIVVDRDNMDALREEAGYTKQKQSITGAHYLISGDITAMGRKVAGDHQLFGILGSSKKQTAYAKVSLNIVDVRTAEIVYSAEGAGEYSLQNREVIGFGGTAGYDATLSGKVLDFAIHNAIEHMVSDLDNGRIVLPS